MPTYFMLLAVSQKEDILAEVHLSLIDSSSSQLCPNSLILCSLTCVIAVSMISSH